MNPLTVGLLLLQMQLATVEGVVTKPGGSEPLGRAAVTLNPVGKPAIPAGPSAVTEDDGRFAIREIPPGDYQLIVDTARYGRVVYGQRRPDGPGAVLTLAAGQRRSDLRLSMIATGAITGRISGRNGEPAVNAGVQAFRYVYQNGKRVLQIVRTGTTDDRGDYRLFGLPAGQYLVSAVLNALSRGPYLVGEIAALVNPNVRPQAVFTDSGLNLSELITVSESMQAGNIVHRVLEDGTVQEESWTPIYYPSAMEARHAVPIDLSAGATLSGVNISIGPSRVQRIRGRVMGTSPLSPSQVMLLPEYPTVGTPLSNRKPATTTTDGSFEFSAILPGTYHLHATNAQSGMVSFPIPLEVSDRDIDGLQITLVPGIPIGVTVLLDNRSENPSGPSPVAGVGVTLIPEISGLSPPVSSGQSQSGTGRITIPNVTPGNYQIQIQSPNPPGPLNPSESSGEARRFHVKAVRFGDRDASDGIQVATGSPGRLEIVLTSESGDVRGTVSGAGQVVAAGVTVVLVPERGRIRAELYRATIADSTGSFRFGGVAPGDYRLFAWEDVENGAWQDPDFIRKFETHGQRVTVSGNSKMDVQLTLIPGP